MEEVFSVEKRWEWCSYSRMTVHNGWRVSYNPEVFKFFEVFNTKNFLKAVIMGVVAVEAVRGFKLLAGAVVARVMKKYTGDKDIEDVENIENVEDIEDNSVYTDSTDF